MKRFLSFFIAIILLSVVAFAVSDISSAPAEIVPPESLPSAPVEPMPPESLPSSAPVEPMPPESLPSAPVEPLPSESLPSSAPVEPMSPESLPSAPVEPLPSESLPSSAPVELLPSDGLSRENPLVLPLGVSSVSFDFTKAFNDLNTFQLLIFFELGVIVLWLFCKR